MLKNTFIAGLIKSVHIDKYLKKLKEKFPITDLESDLTIIYREEVKKATANRQLVAIKGTLIFANQDKLHTFLKEIAEVFLINININNSIISSQIENVVDWDIKIENNDISIPNICLNYAHMLNEVYRDDLEEEEEEDPINCNSPCDTNKSRGKTINMCLSKEANMKIIDEI